uniref:RanBD1 domain-containing protein n=1 Tax=Chlamydomonas leiostraca TaxID=1034604 RepID=A0A7S0NBZ4_9CHLO|mmetsp:Transcript_11508/g.28139  ORF Transcript_11508/g.28139 Transcript_11508/m.28139 type:complete len:228 (+) Transcript_11508:81-764(+)|eukprot:CAMPEP_0202859700 /NCGR_PEP_ID=MMETSP1391-20130828/1700_1 /ASSEMBLY_ACC=CAM_ASM_000867 /TAXON_ID=1034604 /ORGANISM="Chlamydomonas leiostraca, Strain SAG 11-49" /LENGTH=227 /DNA_ID=CAMNT_0049538757 /DNA_START=81 /DNA_END=764 /DNA_ORIENTATION=-
MADNGEEAKPNPFAALGSTGNAFGGGGFNFGIGTAPKPAADAEEGGADGDDNEPAVEEECQAEFKPVVQLDEVETSTGEEEEDALLELKSKLYRFDTGSNEWKERGVGVTKLLQHKENKKVRLLMRQDKTLKIRANHIVMPSLQLQEHSGNDKAWVWSTVDFSDGEQKVELFCMRFGSVEKAQEFKKKFEEVQEINGALISAPATKSDEGAKDADALAQEVADKAAV